MLLPLNCMIGIAATNEPISADEIGTNILKAINVLAESDISSDKEELVTRAEFAVFMVRLRGWEELCFQQSGNRYFYDVDPEYYETRHINLATSMGIMEPKESEYFHPKEAVSLEDAVKTLLTVLGYDSIAKSKGGKASDYITIATQKGILKGVNMSAVNISRGDIYKMMINSLDVPVVAEESFSKEKSEYTIEKENTLLTEYHGVYLSKGIVSANDVTSLNADNKEAGDNRIKINGEVYKTTEIGYHDLLGYNVKFYYKVVNGDRELLYAYKHLNEVITLKSTDISDFSNLKYTYSDKNNKKRVASVVGAYFVYNGIAMQGDNDDFVPLTGSVELIDNDNNGKYDVVKINSYEEYAVEALSVNDYVIKTKSNVNLKLDEDKVKIINASNNVELAFKDIKLNSVISVARDSKGEILRVITSPAYIVGKVETISYNDENWEVEINGVMHPVSPALRSAIENSRADNFELGLSASFVFNINDEIAYWYTDYKRIGEGAWTVGLLENAAFGTGLSRKSLEMRVFTITNEFEIFEIKNKVKIDGVKITDMEDAYKKLCRDGENGTLKDDVVPQLIRFKMKSDGTISEIDLVGSEDTNKEGLFKAGTYSVTGDGLRYFNGSFGGQFVVDINTASFLYPAGMDLSDEDKVHYGRAVDDFVNSESYNELNVYKVNSDDMAVSVICRAGETSQTITPAAPLNILLDVRMVIDADDDTRTQLTYARDGNVKKHVLSKNIDLSSIRLNNGETYSLKEGDGFRCNVDSFGEIVHIEPIYDYENHKPLGKNYNNTTPEESGFLRPKESEQFYVGYVNRMKDGILEGVYTIGGDMKFIYNLAQDSTSVYVYDPDEEQLIAGSYNELYDYLGSGNDCSKIVMRAHWYDPYQIFIIK